MLPESLLGSGCTTVIHGLLTCSLSAQWWIQRPVGYQPVRQLGGRARLRRHSCHEVSWPKLAILPVSCRAVSETAEADFLLSYDNSFALHQIEEGHYSLLSRAPKTDGHKKGPSLSGRTLPRVITLGGDHTITLPLLRSINRAYGPVSVIHFDSHLDTCA